MSRTPPREGTPPTGAPGSGLRMVLLGLVLCRGLVLLCVLPPFEGWDEYQHLGYVVHVQETGRPAWLGATSVPNSLMAAALAFPHPTCVVERQLGQLGAVDYFTYWSRAGQKGGGAERSQTGGKPLPLYQAQHGPLYYRLAAPLFAAGGGVGDLRRSISGLRLANLLLIVAAVAVALGTIGRLVPNRAGAALAGLLIATHPLFLVHGVRVANDALGVALATATVAVALTLEGRRLVRGGLAVGVLAGLAIRAKAVHFGLLPFVAFMGVSCIVRDRVGPRRAWASALVLVLALLAVTGDELRANLTRYGSPTPMQEAVMNRAAGRTGADLLGAAGAIDWPRSLARLWLEDDLMVGGWSYLLPARPLVRRHAAVVLACLLGGLFAAARRRRRDRPAFFASWHPAAGCAVLCLSYTAALGYHMVQSRLAWGMTTTNPWYAAAAFPWFLVLVAGASVSWPLGRLRAVLPLALVAIFVAAEATVVWGLMVPTYTAGAGGLAALRRLAALQPPALGIPTLVAAMAGAVLLFACASARVILEFGRERRPGRTTLPRSGRRPPFAMMLPAGTMEGPVRRAAPWPGRTGPPDDRHDAQPFRLAGYPRSVRVEPDPRAVRSALGVPPAPPRGQRRAEPDPDPQFREHGAEALCR